MTTTADLVDKLIQARVAYDAGIPIMSDQEFDALEILLKARDPKNGYFKGVSETPERRKIKLPNKMGSLNRIYNGDDLYRWIDKVIQNTSITEDDTVNIDPKYDGISIGIEYLNGTLSRAWTRGDGYEGEDVTETVRGMSSVPKTLPFMKRVEVRGEVIMAIELFKRLNTAGELGREYKNPRNYVAGQMNRDRPDKVFLENVDVVVFQVVEMDFDEFIDNSGSVMVSNNNCDMLEVLDTVSGHKFKIADGYYENIRNLTFPELEGAVIEAKRVSPYELDGVVVSVPWKELQTSLDFGNDGLNPRWAFKLKVDQDGVATTVKKVHWNISKHGYLKPRVEIEPIDLGGVTITFATGHNAKFVLDSGIGIGAKIVVSRAGDVIPFIEAVTAPTEPDMPSVDDYGTFTWTETGVDIVLDNATDDMELQQLVYFFESIDAPQLRVGSINKLWTAGFKTIPDIIKMSSQDMAEVLGANGAIAYNGLKSRLTDISPWVLAGSTNYFGRGIGKRKLLQLFEAHGTFSGLTKEQIISTDGFDTKSAEKFLAGVEPYEAMLSEIDGYFTFATIQDIQGKFTGMGVCFTGVRDKSLEETITQAGGRIDGSVTKKTTHLVCLDPEGKSGKLDKARKQGIEIMSLDDAREFFQ